MNNQDLNSLMAHIQEGLQEKHNNERNPYVVKIMSDNGLIGYHLSTWCQVTDDILRAKRYSGKEPYKQLEVIQKNINHMLSSKEEDMFHDYFKKIRDTHYKNAGKIWLDFEYLDNPEPHTIKITHIQKPKK